VYFEILLDHTGTTGVFAFDQIGYSIIPTNADIDISEASGQIVIRQSSAPSDPKIGWIWIDSDNGRTYIWTGSAWTFMGAIEDGASVGGTGPEVTSASTASAAKEWADYVEVDLVTGDIVTVVTTFTAEITQGSVAGGGELRIGASLSVGAGAISQGNRYIKTTDELEHSS